jgi:hypothetical protein
MVVRVLEGKRRTENGAHGLTGTTLGKISTFGPNPCQAVSRVHRTDGNGRRNEMACLLVSHARRQPGLSLAEGSGHPRMYRNAWPRSFCTGLNLLAVLSAAGPTPGRSSCPRHFGRLCRSRSSPRDKVSSSPPDSRQDWRPESADLAHREAPRSRPGSEPARPRLERQEEEGQQKPGSLRQDGAAILRGRV